MQLFAYRQFHRQTNVAATLLTAMMELGSANVDMSIPRQELTFHGLIQVGPWREASGTPLKKALRYASDTGVNFAARRDPKRADDLREILRAESPNFEFRFPEELGALPTEQLDIDRDIIAANRVLLVEASRLRSEPSFHLLLVRRVEGRHFSVMNSATGRNYDFGFRELRMHLITQLTHGPVAFAGGLYAFTGIAFVLSRNPFPQGNLRSA
ncbi:MAG TPA: hypothetical protein VG345_10445 [Bryobacteraceae bacterium]|jgi:hypothetical protein|nr:hypothetical protein [Bryobacteraceae bacterium]